MSTFRLAVAAAVMPVLVGCSASGLDAKSAFGCKAPDGVTCMSVTGVYATSRANALPGQQPSTPDRSPETKPAPASSQAPAREQAASPLPRGPTLSTGAPLRSPPRVLRIWIAPYEDSDGDLRDQSYMYVTVDPGAWQIEHARRAIRDRFAPIRAVAPAAPVTSAETPRSVEGTALTVQPGHKQDRLEVPFPGGGAVRQAGGQ